MKDIVQITLTVVDIEKRIGNEKDSPWQFTLAALKWVLDYPFATLHPSHIETATCPQCRKEFSRSVYVGEPLDFVMCEECSTKPITLVGEFISADIIKTLKLQLHDYVDDLRIVHGQENKIELVEEVLAINDCKMVLSVTLTGRDQLDWLNSELRDGPRPEWISNKTFADREVVKKRYGWT